MAWYQHCEAWLTFSDLYYDLKVCAGPSFPPFSAPDNHWAAPLSLNWKWNKFNLITFPSFSAFLLPAVCPGKRQIRPSSVDSKPFSKCIQQRPRFIHPYGTDDHTTREPSDCWIWDQAIFQLMSVTFPAHLIGTTNLDMEVKLAPRPVCCQILWLYNDIFKPWFFEAKQGCHHFITLLCQRTTDGGYPILLPK